MRIQGFATERESGGMIAVLDADDLVAWLRAQPDQVTPTEIADCIALYAIELSTTAGGVS